MSENGMDWPRSLRGLSGEGATHASRIHGSLIAIGIDMGKSTLHMVGLDSSGAIVLREKVSRGRIASRLVNLPSLPRSDLLVAGSGIVQSNLY
jgi:hypothetical protein